MENNYCKAGNINCEHYNNSKCKHTDGGIYMTEDFEICPFPSIKREFFTDTEYKISLKVFSEYAKIPGTESFRDYINRKRRK